MSGFLNMKMNMNMIMLAGNAYYAIYVEMLIMWST